MDHSTSDLRLGPLEELLWWYDRASPFHFVMAAEYAGTTASTPWQQILRKVQLRHPLLNVSIQADENGSPHFVFDNEAEIPLRIAQGSSSWQHEMSAELGRTFLKDQAPLVRAVLIRKADSVVLVLALHHSIADGLSIAGLFQEILLALSGTFLEPLPLVPSHESRLGVAPAQIDRSGQADLETPSVTQLNVSDFRGRLSVDRLTVDSTTTAAFVRAARGRGTTVQAMLLAALLIAGQRDSGSWRNQDLRILVPVSTRKHIAGQESVRPAFHIVPLNIAPADISDFWTLAGELGSQIAGPKSVEMATHIATAVTGLVSTGLSVGSADAFMRGTFTSNATVSNLGNLPFETRIGPVEMTALWGPVLCTGVDGEQFVGVSTLDGVMHLTNASAKPIEGLLASVREIMERESDALGKA